MIKIAIPMVISALILNITNLIDTVTIQARLRTALDKDFNTVIQMHSDAINEAVRLSRLDLSDVGEVVKYFWGAYGSALDFKNLVPTITIQLGVSALPALAAAWVVKNKKATRSTIETVLRVGMLIALPAGIGMASLATPILTILYGRGSSSDAISVIAPIMAAYGFATGIIAISTPTTNMLQAIGRADIPVKSVVVASVCKILCNFILVGNPKLNIYGAVVGTILFYVIIVTCNMALLLRISKVHVRWSSVFLNMGTVSALIAIALAAIVYLISLLLIKGIAKEDISVIPKGEKIAKVLEKYGLLG